MIRASDPGAICMITATPGCMCPAAWYLVIESFLLVMARFSVGDLVQLKSGGPTMTVTRVVGNSTSGLQELKQVVEGLEEGDVVCTWFAGEEKQSAGFRSATLMPADGP